MEWIKPRSEYVSTEDRVTIKFSLLVLPPPVPQDSCVRQALHCNRLTKLITLQIHFLNTGQNTMLINLGHQKLMDCIMALPRFYQVRTLTGTASIILWCLTLGAQRLGD